MLFVLETLAVPISGPFLEFVLSKTELQLAELVGGGALFSRKM